MPQQPSIILRDGERLFISRATLASTIYRGQTLVAPTKVSATFWKVASTVTVPMGLEIALLNPKLDVLQVSRNLLLCWKKGIEMYRVWSTPDTASPAQQIIQPGD